jgi:hypothetical protein
VPDLAAGARALLAGSEPAEHERGVRRVASPVVVVEITAMVVAFGWTSWRLWMLYRDLFTRWQTGDWLLNYSGGFMRRALVGELIERLTPHDVSILKVTLVIQLVVLGGIFAATLFLFVRTTRSPAWAMLVLSPAFLLFEYLNPEGAVHKEIIPVLALALFSVGYRTERFLAFAVPATALYVLAVMSHETSYFLLPAFLFLVAREWLRNPSRRRTLVTLGVVLCIVVAVGLAISFLFPGGAAQRTAICATFARRGIVCDQPTLEYLNYDLGASIHELWSRFFPAYWSYLPVIAAGLVPLFAVRFLPRFRWFALVFGLSMVPVFVTGTDWGRWVWTSIACLSLVALAVAEDAELAEMDVPLYAAAAFCIGWGFWYFTNGTALAPGLLERWLS